jgi:hypothetical protein
MRTPADTVTSYMAAYNCGDLDESLTHFSPFAEIFSYPPNQLQAKGVEEVRAFHVAYWHTAPRGLAVHRAVFGEHVVEQYVLMQGSKYTGFAVVTYTVNDGKIQRIDYIESEQTDYRLC